MNNYNPDYAYNPDLEANLIPDNGYQAQQGNQYGYQQQQNPNSQVGAPGDFRNNLSYSIKFNLLLLTISLGKIIASSIILATSIACIGPRESWVMVMIVHDVLYGFSLLVTIGLVRYVNSEIARIQRQISSRSRQSSRNNLGESVPGQNPGAQNTNVDQQVPGNFMPRNTADNRDRLPPEQATYIQQQQTQTTNLQVAVLATEIAQRQRLISKLTGTAELLYVLLFIFGQFLLFFEQAGDCKSPAVKTLMLVYIILGYLWLLSPIIFILLACLCLPVLVFCIFIFGGRGSQVPANRNLINNLPIKKFTNELPGDHECAICMTDYQEGDNLVQLKCSPMHHFHDECIKKWLEVNGQCPICRARIEEMNFQAESNT